MSEISRLYGLKPLRSTAASIESLNHYLVRSAEEHSLELADLLRYVIFETMSKPPSKYFSKEVISRIGSNCPITEETVRAVENLTKRNDIRSMTLMPYHHIISKKMLIRKYNAWCATCYENPATRYDTVLSTLVINELCPFCLDPLVSNCPFEDCKKPFFTLMSHRVSGFCPHCKRFLGIKSFYEQQKPSVELDYQISITKNLSELLENWETAHLCSKEYLFQATELYIRKFTFRSVNEFCRRVSIGNDSYRFMQDENHLIPLSTLLNMAFEMNVSVLELISERALEILENRVAPTFSSQRAGEMDETFLKQEIKKYLEIEATLSIEQVAAQLNVSRITLEKYCPDEYEIIRNRHKASRTYDRIAILQMLQKHIDDPLDSSSVEDIAIEAGCSATYVRITFPDQYYKIKERAKATQKRKIRKSIDTIRNEFLGLLEQKISPPLSLYQIAQRIGTYSEKLEIEFPELCETLKKQLEEYAAQEHLELRYRLENLAQEQPPLSLSQIAVRMNVGKVRLKRLFPDLCEFIRDNYGFPDIDKIRQALQEVTIAEPPLSVYSFARSLMYPAKTLLIYFPEQCTQITERYWDYYGINEEVESQLERYLSNNFYPPLPLITIALNLGHTASTLHNNFPRLSSELVKRFEAYRNSQSKERLEAVKADVYEAILTVIENGEYPNRSRVGRNLSKSSPLDMLHPEIKAYHAQLLKDLGYTDDTAI